MRWWSLCLLAAVALLGGCATVPQHPAAAERRAPVTLLVSMDGFRPDYLGHGLTPRIEALAANGTIGTMRPVFPVKTFPNHWSIVTGLIPDHHGIVANKMEDTRRPGALFTNASDDPFWWSEATPLWVQAERAGIRTAAEFWPGSIVAIGGERRAGIRGTIGGTRPADWNLYAEAVSGEQRVRTVLDWLRRPPATRPRFVALYLDAVDQAGHDFGPDTPEMRHAVAAMDGVIGGLIDGLAALRQPADIVLVSDHGMVGVSRDRTIVLDTIADRHDFRVIENGPYATIEPVAGHAERLEERLLRPHPHMQCWRKADVPARFRYGRHPRVTAYLCMAEMGWYILPDASTPMPNRGNHGYDHDAPEMTALFVASGPRIVPAKRLGKFDIVDVASLLRRLVGLAPVADDGDPQVLAGVVRQ